MVEKMVLLTAKAVSKQQQAERLTQMKQMSNSPNSENGIMQRPAPVHRASLLPIVLLSAAGFTVMTTDEIGKALDLG